MILHLLVDEKFSDYVIRQFGAPEMESKLVVVSDTTDFRHITLVREIEVVKVGSPEWRLLLSSLVQFSGIVFHGMFWPWEEEVMKMVPQHVNVAWMFWGGEIYGRSDVRMNRLAPISSLVQRVHKSLRPQKDKIFELPQELFRRIDYCLTGEFEEYEFVRNWLNNNLKFIWYTYYSIEETLGNLINDRNKGDNIIIGNSASIECNYFEVLCHIWRFKLAKRRLILPLSYGSPWVRNAVRNVAVFLYGSNVLALEQFMDRSNYNQLLRTCSVMIMAHYRPQAQGNIITGLWLGMRVYLSKHSIAYKFFKRLGFIIFSVEDDLNIRNPEAMKPLPDADVAINRRILQEWYGRDHVKAGAKAVVDMLKQPREE